MRKHLWLILLVGLSVLSLGSASPRTVATDISGTWKFTFDMTSYMTKGSVTKGAKQGSKIIITKRASKTVTFVLEQQGEKLTVICCDPEEKMTGAVQGNQVTFEREFSREGKTSKAVYSGTLETPTKMTGTRKIIGDTDQNEHKWTATKNER
jgi:hypothetical protein